MTQPDPDPAAALRAALGLGPSDPGPPDLAAAAFALDAAATATRMDAGSVVLLAVTLVRQVRAAPPGTTPVEAACSALGRAWPVGTSRDLAELAAALLTLAALWADDEQLAAAADVGRLMP